MDVWYFQWYVSMTEITTPRYKGRLEPASVGFNDLSVAAERNTHGTAGVKDFSGAKLFFAKKNLGFNFPLFPKSFIFSRPSFFTTEVAFLFLFLFFYLFIFS